MIKTSQNLDNNSFIKKVDQYLKFRQALIDYRSYLIDLYFLNNSINDIYKESPKKDSDMGCIFVGTPACLVVGSLLIYWSIGMDNTSLFIFGWILRVVGGIIGLGGLIGVLTLIALIKGGIDEKKQLDFKKSSKLDNITNDINNIRFKMNECYQIIENYIVNNKE